MMDPLLLSVTPSPSVAPSGLLRYTLTFGNPDPANALDDVRVVDVLDVNLESPAVASRGAVADQAVAGRSVDASWTYDSATRTLTCARFPLIS